MINSNCQEYDFNMEYLLLSCNKPFHFSSKDTHINEVRIEWTVRRIQE